MPLYMHSIGIAAPPYSVAQDRAAEIARNFVCMEEKDRSQVLATIFRRTKVRRRHSVVLERADAQGECQSFYRPARDRDDRGPTTEDRMRHFGRSAPGLAVAAARSALESAGWEPDRVTHLVTVTCTGFDAPGVDIELIKQLGLPQGVSRTQVGFMGCHGALNALRVARGYAESEPRAGVLVCAVELCSLHYQYGWDSQKLVSNALFADGAAAVVGSGSVSPGSRPDGWDLVSNGSHWMPGTEDAMTWRIGNHGFEMTLSAQVPHLIESRLGPWLGAWLAGQGLGLSDIGCWAIHPGGPRIVESVARALDLSAEAVGASLEVFGERGNMSSPTLLFILESLQRRAAPRPCVALGFGPGLAVEAALLR